MSIPKNSIAPGILLGGKYKVGEVLGEGGMGCVYRAENVEIGLKVAIKHLHREFSAEKEAVRRFKREAKLAASIGHDNICEVIDFGTADDGSPFLVMPVLKGYPLSTLIHDFYPLHYSVIADIICQTLSALSAAHRENIVHRDLKPDNIFITKVGDRNNFVKLLDFGISKIMDQDSVMEMTKTGTILGTPFYMAPEQAKGKKEIDARTDIWAVGVILYEALTGKRPFDGDSYNEIMFKICDDPITPLSQYNPDVPAYYEDIVLRALNRDPEHRFQSADEMRNAVARARELTTSAISMPRISANPAFALTIPSVVPAAREKKRYKHVYTALIAAVLVLLLTIFFILKSSNSTDSNMPPSAQKPVVSSSLPVESLTQVKNSSKISEQKDVSTDKQLHDDSSSESSKLVSEEENNKSKAIVDVPLKKDSASATRSTTAKSTDKKQPTSTLKGRFNTEVDPKYDD